MYGNNKLNVISKVLDLIDYIDQNQNSPDFQTYKRILLKLVSSMSDNMILDASLTESVEVPPAEVPVEIQKPLNTPITDYKDGLPEGYDITKCQVYNNAPSSSDDCGGDCKCNPNQSKDVHERFMSDKDYIPKINLQETIEKIKSEIGNASKN